MYEHVELDRKSQGFEFKKHENNADQHKFSMSYTRIQLYVWIQLSFNFRVQASNFFN